MVNIKTYDRNDLIEWIYRNNYDKNCTQFVCDFSNLFTENDGTINKPYPKQNQFMNHLSKKDRVIVVLKCRQCLEENSMILIDKNVENVNSEKSIKELFNLKYRGKIFSLINNQLIEDKVLDIWETGYQEIFEIELYVGITLYCSKYHKFKSDNNWVTLNDLKENDRINTVYGYNSIKSIKSTGIYKQTYDLTTKNTHSYIANGILCHNSGFSTSIVGKAFHNAFFGRQPDTIIVSSTKTQALKVMRRVKQCFEEMPAFMKPKFEVDQAQEIILPNKARIISLSSNPHGVRGWTGDFLLDEFAMHTERESEELYESAYPSTTKGSRIITVSTPFGIKGMFYKLATMSLEEITGRKPKFESKKFYVYWQDAPHVKKAVEEDGLFDGFSDEMIEQEYNLKFRVDNEQEQFFTREFILSTIRDNGGTDGNNKDESIPLYSSYTDMGIPIDYIKELNKPLDPKYMTNNFFTTRYSFISAGWDLASTEADSIMVLIGELRNNPNHFEIFGEFWLNRFGHGADSIKNQCKYAKRILQIVKPNKLIYDKTGIGRGGEVEGFFDDDEDTNFITEGFIYHQENKYQGFLDLKQMMVEQRLKRRWEEDKQTTNILNQLMNLRLYSVGGSQVKSKRLRDDYGNALMLSINFNTKIKAGVFFI